MRLLSILVLFCFGNCIGTHFGASICKAEVDFARDIRPLLSDRCFTCHGPDEEHRESELRVDDYASLTEDRGGYQVVTPKEAEASEMIVRIQSEDPDSIMPPPDMGKPLTSEEKELLIKWIDSGATWRQHWAYESPMDTEDPVLDSRESGKNWIDAYVLEKLAERGGEFSGQAQRLTLLRRLSFDLNGLPPTSRDIKRFGSPSSDGASDENSEDDEWIDLYVDELLSRSAYGERMAMYWLDLVRFADTVGYHGDQDHNVSPYRDYVINSLNDNKPFDRFTIEQLAGDLLEEPTEEQTIATAYNRLLQTSHEGGVQPKEYLAIYQADRVRNVSAVWFGATIGCAQCHDHKYDPFTAKDFYSLAAFFADIDEEQHFKVGTNSLPTKRPPEIDVFSRAEKLWLEQLESDPKQLKSRRTMITKAKQEPRLVRFLPRGNWLDDSGDVMNPAVPEFMGSVTKNNDRATRLELANWLTNSKDGAGLLTARVFVNRLWMLMFGRGLSNSVEDFGGQGEPPTHPELLDKLALEFVRSGWDIKHMLRLIATSRTYQQSSLPNEWQQSNDPENHWLSSQNRFRLPAEMVRDSSLAAAGLLVQEIGGASVKPYQPAGYYRHLNFPVRKYNASKDYGQWRRGLYVHWQRQFLHPMLAAFDAPTREECAAKRNQSNTPLAALVWLNDPSFTVAAQALATRTLSSGGEKDGELALKNMFASATSRNPDETELEVLQRLLAEARENYQDSRAAKEFLDSNAMSNPKDISDIELAAWTTVARAILNLSETYTRN